MKISRMSSIPVLANHHEARNNSSYIETLEKFISWFFVAANSSKGHDVIEK